MEIKDFLRWDKLERVSSNKILSSSTVFLFSVPVFARIFSDLPTSIHIPITKQVLILNIELPFSWILFFFAALFLMIGNLVFYFLCPEIIQKYKNYLDFSSDGRSSADLQLYIKKIIPESLGTHLENTHTPEGKQAKQRAAEYLFDKYLGKSNAPHRQSYVINGLTPQLSSQISENEKAIAFAVIRDASSYYNMRYIKICAALYLISLFLISIIIFQNIIFVIKYLLRYGI